jgi:hypothetical protein
MQQSDSYKHTKAVGVERRLATSVSDSTIDLSNSLSSYGCVIRPGRLCDYLANMADDSLDKLGRRPPHLDRLEMDSGMVERYVGRVSL